MSTLFYVHDPMCSWCWAFRPVLQQLLEKLPESVKIEYLLGGLAPDNQEPMNEATKVMVQHHWHTIIEQVPGTLFNFDFWEKNIPKRSTYISCRAVLAAKAQRPQSEQKMIEAIQHAYYLQAMNPSHEETLKACAVVIGLNQEEFARDLNSERMHQRLKDEMTRARALPIRGFPSLVLKKGGNLFQIPIDYNDVQLILQAIAVIVDEKSR